MPELFDPAAHEPARPGAWDEERVRAAIRELAAEADAGYDEERQWPLHPLDEDDTYPTPDRGFSDLYLGSAGVLWALDHLAREGAIPRRVGDDRAARAAYDLFLGGEGKLETGLLAGQVGILLACYRLAPEERVADALHELIRQNISEPRCDLVWGAPGTMRAAWWLWRWTGDERFAELWCESADAVWDLWRFDAELGCHVWSFHRRGRVVHVVGAGHGLAGNISSLLQGEELLTDARREALHARARQAALTLALREDGLANWPPSVGDEGPHRVQWCHGAPGVITSLAALPPEPELDELLLEAGRLVWQAGPVAKGPGLCHGTAGNGYAFLALHRRTGDPLWLGRARDFAGHALDQRRRQGARYSLWTGDLGLACYLRDCLSGTFAVPSLDTF